LLVVFASAGTTWIGAFIGTQCLFPLQIEFGCDANK